MKIKETFLKFVPLHQMVKKQHHRAVKIPIIIIITTIMSTTNKNIGEKTVFSLLILSLGTQWKQ